MSDIKKLEGQLLNRRGAIALGLAGIAAVHVLDLPGKWEEVRYLGVAYVLVILASIVLIERVIVHGTKLDLLGSAGLSASVIVGFVINRTVGMPNAKDDIGNWLEPLGLLSLVVEAFVLWQALAAYAAQTKLEARQDLHESAVKPAAQLQNAQ